MNPNNPSSLEDFATILNITLDAIDKLSDKELDALSERIAFVLWDREATKSLYESLNENEK